MGQTQQELASYGDMHFSGKEHRGSLILQLMTRFATSFISSIDGTSTEISTKELCGGARIYYIFNSVFGSSLESIDPTSNLSALDIRTAIRNSTGPRPSLFVPEMAFDLLVKPQIKLLEIPSDQPTDIEKQTRNLISEYIAKPNSIVLAVSPANVDIVNSEALKLARHVDPLGRRTIGVLTKVDLMDHGTNALDILSGRVYPLKLGFIGVVNRSQQDIQGSKPMEEALKDEADFFKHHPAYRNIATRC
ncbi:hypothetical protein BN1723_016630, partial [Verticillium longisporum]